MDRNNGINPLSFPFSAIVGQQSMKTALVLNIVDPTIGGVLIRGAKGSGKSTAVRALSGILPEIKVVDNCPYNCPPDNPAAMHGECLNRYRNGDKLTSHRIKMPVIELPLNATEDRVAGTIHIEHALKTGERRFEPGLLASANRGILYVDEVNLLDDHIVDLLLDAAASGINTVEREGVSQVHPSRFILIGSMNPEEGELRPQFLDRFALCVEMQNIRDITARQDVVRRRTQFDGDPESFYSQWVDQEELLGDQILLARRRMEKIEVPEKMIELAVRLALAVDAQGHRADITMVKAARVLAALLEKSCVESEEILEAAHLVLPHRMGKNPLEKAGFSLKLFDEAVARVLSGSRTPAFAERMDRFAEDLRAAHEAEEIQVPGAAAAGSILFDFLKKKAKRSSLSRKT